MRIEQQLPPIDAFDVNQFKRMMTFEERYGMSYDDAVAENEKVFDANDEAQIKCLITTTCSK
jgi:hypothetical protein